MNEHWPVKLVLALDKSMAKQLQFTALREAPECPNCSSKKSHSKANSKN